MTWSLVIPGIVAVHFDRLFHIVGKSRMYIGKNTVHYRMGRYVGKTIRNTFGEPNHYDCHGTPIGYSRIVRKTKIVHYNRYGKPIGRSR